MKADGLVVGRRTGIALPCAAEYWVSVQAKTTWHFFSAAEKKRTDVTSSKKDAVLAAFPRASPVFDECNLSFSVFNAKLTRGMLCIELVGTGVFARRTGAFLNP